MYYHKQELRYVEYGKILPQPESTSDCFLSAYRWLGRYCGYCPQVWLSRSMSQHTGFRNGNSEDAILFGFDIIKGFPIDHSHWCNLLNTLINTEPIFEKQTKAIIESLDCFVKDCKDSKEVPVGIAKEWLDCGTDLDTFLRKYMFVENDQVVVPSLNLKAAKSIICRNEKQKKALRMMGFIEDRICIKNIKFW